MKNYFIKTPWWLKKIYPQYIWDIPAKEKIVYLTFDDGPHNVATPFVLDELKKAGAKASFFCIGKNVLAEPVIYRRILDEGHAVGNHTFNHLNGWKTGNDVYLKDVAEAGKHIDSDLFRPPYGRIGRFQASALANALKKPSVKVIMWDILSADFDTKLTGEDCLRNIILNLRPGSIVIMHDSQKAWERLEYLLPLLLVHLRNEGYQLKRL